MARHGFLCVEHKQRAPSQPVAQPTLDIDEPVNRGQRLGALDQTLTTVFPGVLFSPNVQ